MTWQLSGRHGPQETKSTATTGATITNLSLGDCARGLALNGRVAGSLLVCLQYRSQPLCPCFSKYRQVQRYDDKVKFQQQGRQCNANQVHMHESTRLTMKRTKRSTVFEPGRLLCIADWPGCEDRDCTVKQQRERR